MDFGTRIRSLRLDRKRDDPAYSVRQVAHRIGVEPSYLSKVERNIVPPPSEATIRNLAHELDEDPDDLLGAAGKVSTELRDIILKRPLLFAKLLRDLDKAPESTVKHVVREVRDGDW